ncbi:MAG: hypothetical protein WCG10_05075 [Chlamydiota bacterium]
MSSTTNTTTPNAFNTHYPDGTFQIGVAAQHDPNCVGYYKASAADVAALKAPYQDPRYFSYLRPHMDARSTVMQGALPDSYSYRNYESTMRTLNDCYVVVSDKDTGITPSGTVQSANYETLFFNGKTFQPVTFPAVATGQYQAKDHEEMDQVLRANQLVCQKALEAYTLAATTNPPTKTAQQTVVDQYYSNLGKAFTDYKVAYNRFDLELKTREELVDRDPSASSTNFKNYQKDAHDFDPVAHFIDLAPKHLEDVCSPSTSNPSAAKNKLATDLFNHYKTLKGFLKQTEAFAPAEAVQILLTEAVQKLNEAFDNSPSSLNHITATDPNVYREFEADKANCKNYSNADFVRVLTRLNTSQSKLPSYIEKIASPKQKKIAELWFQMKDRRLTTLEHEKLPYHPRSLARAAIGLGYTFYTEAKNLVKPSILTDAKTAKIMAKYFKNKFASESIFPIRQASADSIQEALDSFDLLTDLCPQQTAYDRSELYLDLIKETMQGTAGAQKNALLTAETLANFDSVKRDSYNAATEKQRSSITALEAIKNEYPNERSSLYIHTVKDNYIAALGEYFDENKAPVAEKEINLLLQEIENLSKTNTDNSLIGTYNMRIDDILSDIKPCPFKTALEQKRAQSAHTISTFDTPATAYKRSKGLLSQIQQPLSPLANAQKATLLNAQTIGAFETTNATAFYQELTDKHQHLQKLSQIAQTQGTAASTTLFGRTTTVNDNYNTACIHYVTELEPAYSHCEGLLRALANDAAKTTKLHDFLAKPLLSLPPAPAAAAAASLTTIKTNAETAFIASIQPRLDTLMNDFQTTYGANNNQGLFNLNAALLVQITQNPTQADITTYLNNHALLEAEVNRIDSLLSGQTLPPANAQALAVAAFKAAVTNDFTALHNQLTTSSNAITGAIQQELIKIRTFDYTQNARAIHAAIIAFDNVKDNLVAAVATVINQLKNIPSTLSQAHQDTLNKMKTDLSATLTQLESALIILKTQVATLPVITAAAQQAQQTQPTAAPWFNRKILAGATVAVGVAAIGSMYLAQNMMSTDESSN